jgi:hypothetical protein
VLFVPFVHIRHVQRGAFFLLDARPHFAGIVRTDRLQCRQTSLSPTPIRRQSRQPHFGQAPLTARAANSVNVARLFADPTIAFSAIKFADDV